MHNEGTHKTSDLSHLATNLLSIKGITALTLVNIHQLAAGILHSSWRCVDAHKDAYIKVHAEGQHGNDVALISVSMPLQQSAMQAGRHSASDDHAAIRVNSCTKCVGLHASAHKAG